MPIDTTLACNVHDDDDVVDDNYEDSDEELRAYYDEEWEYDHMPYVSWGVPANYDDSDDEELGFWYDEEWMQYHYMTYVGGKLPASLFNLEGKPLLIGGRSIFAAPVSLFDCDEGLLLIGGKYLRVLY